MVTFILKARAFKKMTGLSEGLSIKTTQGVTLLQRLSWRCYSGFEPHQDGLMRAIRIKDLALLSGINPERVVMIVDNHGCAGGGAGSLYSLDKSYKPFTYLQILHPCLPLRLLAGWAVIARLRAGL